jgi:preprotein translocase subunit SecD
MINKLNKKNPKTNEETFPAQNYLPNSRRQKTKKTKRHSMAGAAKDEQQIRQYLTDQEVKQLFEDISKRLLRTRPDNIHAFIVDHITNPPKSKKKVQLFEDVVVHEKDKVPEPEPVGEEDREVLRKLLEQGETTLFQGDDSTAPQIVLDLPPIVLDE